MPALTYTRLRRGAAIAAAVGGAAAAFAVERRHLRSLARDPEYARLLNLPRTSRAVMGARLGVPPFSSPVQPALIRYVAFGPDATPAQVAFYERMLIECRSDMRAAVGVALSDMSDALERLTRDVTRTLAVSSGRL